jgi:agmatine/peptidylarginine deiminase
LKDGNGFRLLDFRFTGWGGKFEASRDDRLVEHLDHIGIFSIVHGNQLILLWKAARSKPTATARC